VMRRPWMALLALFAGACAWHGSAVEGRDVARQDDQAVLVNGASIHYETYGQGPPLLLLHAGTLSGAMWKPYLEGFAGRYRVIVPDLRGHGRSDRPDTAMSYRLLAEDMAALVRALDLEKPLIAGFSDGGQVALEIGMRHPDLPRALVVGGAWFRYSVTYRAWVEDALGDVDSPEADLSRLKQNHPAWVAWLDALYGPDGWQSLMTPLKHMWTTPLNYTPDDFRRVRAPTLVLIGDRDELVPVEEAAEMARLLPDAELAVVPEADHGAFFSAKAAAFQAVMMDFLSRRGSQGKDPTDR